MDAAGLKRLREEQDLAIKQTNENIATWERFRGDYVALQKRLKTLPDKTTHEVMVPMGKKAFMPGQLIHTNEILVLLGDNWFAERSAKQACEIINRRISAVDTTLGNYHKQRELLEGRLDFTQDFQNISEGKDLIEIKEDFDEEKEKIWKDEHRKNMLSYRQQQKAAETRRGKQDTSGGSTAEPTDEDLWRRLEELELQEHQRRELHRLSGEEDDGDEDEDAKEDEGATRKDRKIKWEDEGSELSDSGSQSASTCETDSEGSSSPEPAAQRPRSIRFHHSKDISPDNEAVDAGKNEGPQPSIQSPRDIYKLYSPRSILKSASFEASEVGNGPSGTDAMLPGLTQAFPGAVIEQPIPTHPQSQTQAGQANPGYSDDSQGVAKDPPAIAVSQSVVERPTPAVMTDTVEPPKRVSRFKAQRQQRLDKQ